ncbi:MAG TPA: hypothetical protein VFS52_18100 [Steroidobacteraceae bacterium]|nr:hypothetical protein [Steroidobacteraceae bacterium]
MSMDHERLRSGSGTRSMARFSSSGSSPAYRTLATACEPIIASAGQRLTSMKRQNLRMRQSCSGWVGRSGGLSNASSMYSSIGEDSVNTRPSCTIAGTMPSGLIARNAGECCSRFARSM